MHPNKSTPSSVPLLLSPSLPFQVINVDLDKDPRSESCFEMFQKTLCPNFKVFSFTSAICYLQLTMFILQTDQNIDPEA